VFAMSVVTRIPVKPQGHIRQAMPCKLEYSRAFLDKRILIDSIKVSNSACLPSHDILSIIFLLSLSKSAINAGDDRVSINREGIYKVFTSIVRFNFLKEKFGTKSFLL